MTPGAAACNRVAAGPARIRAGTGLEHGRVCGCDLWREGEAPQLDLMMAGVRRRRFDIVVCVKLDRLARSVHYLVSLGQDFTALGVDLVVLDQAIDTTTSAGRFTFHILAAVAELERALIRDPVVAGIRRARAKGQSLGRPREHSVDVVRARDLLAQGLSLRAVGRALGVHLSLLKTCRPRMSVGCGLIHYWLVMVRWIGIVLGTLRSAVRTHRELALENLALRQQLAVCKARQPRPRLTEIDRIFWVVLSRLWASWRHSLLVVRPQTVIGWHRQGFRRYWAWKSRRRSGRPAISAEFRALIQQMSSANPLWGAPRIHGELLKLGITGIPRDGFEVHGPTAAATVAGVAHVFE